MNFRHIFTFIGEIILTNLYLLGTMLLHYIFVVFKRDLIDLNLFLVMGGAMTHYIIMTGRHVLSFRLIKFCY